MTLLQNWELLSRAQHDAEHCRQLAGTVPSPEAPRHEAARGDTAAQPGTSPPRLHLAPLLAGDVPGNASKPSGTAQAMP